ncbi:MAG: hydrogenase maturation protease [Desulfuromonadales bacterium]|nr:hydrogenase maturation protease [Desulfuromonadales bacterium]
MPATERAPLLVMGVGNLLRGDDGFGVRVIEHLAGQPLPAGVELLDAGTSIVDLIDELRGRRKLVVIDAVRGDQPAGTLYRFSPEQVDTAAVPADSLHQVGLLETLKLADLIDCRPTQTVVIGVQPAATGLGIGLSPAVDAAIEAAGRLVRRELDEALATLEQH